MYLKRIIYDQLLDWKNDTSHSTLEVSGARQVGKTYIINKFADENFRHKIYINLFEQSGQQFMECYKQATSWTPGTKRPEHPLHDAFRLFDIEFTDSDDTVIIIDEIQESAEIYNRIREFTRQFKSHFIITGSYLGKIYESDFRYSSGDVTTIPIYTIIDTFTNDSIRYFTNILDTRVFTQIFLSICRILNRESRGLKEDSISEELQKLVTRDYSSNISKAVCNRAISWLYFSGIIGFCAKITEMDVLDFKPASRCYFMDLGLANYYLTLTGTDAATLSGTLNENFVYINLKKRQDFPAEIAFETPAFATYKGGEIDFVAQTLKNRVRYLIEVKAGKGTATTSLKALEHGKADHLLYLKGDTKGGIDKKVRTLPIYLLERFNFQ